MLFELLSSLLTNDAKAFFSEFDKVTLNSVLVFLEPIDPAKSKHWIWKKYDKKPSFIKNRIHIFCHVIDTAAIRHL